MAAALIDRLVHNQARTTTATRGQTMPITATW